MDPDTESTTPKPLATHTPVAAAQDLVKLGKVQKVKRPRINKAKQGRPSHLSVSQKRKLVRLYVYTNLPLDVIRKLVEHFGTTQIQTRALQYILKSFLLDRYNMLRPGSTDASHKRVFQIRLCQDVKKRHPQDIKEMFEIDSPSPFPALRVGTIMPYQSFTDMNGMPAEELVEALKPEKSSETRNCVDQLEISRGTNRSSPIGGLFNAPIWGLFNAPITLTAEHGYVQKPHDVQDLPLSSDQLFAPAQTVLLAADDPFMGAAGNEILDNLLPGRKEIEAEATAETARELYLANNDDASATKLPLGHDIGAHFGTDNTADSALAAHPDELSVMTLIPRSSPKGSQSDKVVIDTETSKGKYIKTNDSVECNLNAWYNSETKPLIEASSGTRTLIDYVLMDITLSYDSPSSQQEYCDPDPMEGKVWRSHPATRYSWQSNTPLPGKPVDSYRTETQFECSKGLEQWSHRPLHCSNCIFDTGLMYYKGRFWFNKDINWSDEYGNTSLHVAAALGACPTILVEIIRYGGDVNRTNTAGENFLHVFQPENYHYSFNACKILVTELNDRDFDFGHRDAWHSTVLDVLKWTGMAELRDPILCDVNPLDLKESLIIHIHRPSSIDKIKELLHAGANINEREACGRTPLHLAITNGETEITKFLLSFRPNLHARDRWRKGVLAVGQEALRRAKSDARMYAKITACMTLAIDAGAIAEPTSHDEWRLPNYQHWPGDPTQRHSECSQESCADTQN